MKNSMRAPFQHLLAVTALLSLAACGGGGGGGGTAPLSPGGGTGTTPGTSSQTLGSYCKPLFTALTPGTTWNVVLEDASNAGSTTTMDVSVGNLTHQAGYAVYPVNLVQTDSTTSTSGVTTTVRNATAYNYPSALDQVTQYGDIVTTTTTITPTGGTPQSTSTNESDVYSPTAFIDNSYALVAGGSILQTSSYIQTVTGTGASNVFDVSTTVKFVDVESIKVPAGTYLTCRVDTTTAFTGLNITTTSTEYALVGAGVPVKTVSDAGTVMEATSVKVNGVPK
ncbi:MAG: hypothetical protein KGL43_01080 [Burkholderiales bacterium]|nr:hypothetical protein [Burkholderiales bacterium]